MPGNIDPELAKYGLVGMVVVISVVTICAAAVAIVYFRSNPEDAATQTNEFLRSQSAVRLVTVFVVIIALAALSMLQALNEGAIALLSGIAGYVLGGIPAEEKGKRFKEAETKDKP